MLNNEALNKAIQIYMEYPPRAEIRKLVTSIIEKYLEHANKHTDTSCLMISNIPYCEECSKKKKAMQDYSAQNPLKKPSYDSWIANGGDPKEWIDLSSQNCEEK